MNTFLTLHSFQSACVFLVRYLQTYHMESLGYNDIGYNFLVGGDGAVYIGRGWNIQGEHATGYNERSVGIAFIGTFNKIDPTNQQLCAAQNLIAEGVRLNKLNNNYKLFGYRQLIPSENPGQALYGMIKKWKNWSDENIDE